MNSKIPDCYSGLARFRELFERGNPILTYHKLGPRPIRARLKGLYLSRSQFTQQLKELRRAGFSNGSPSSCAGPVTGKRVVLTFDDGYANVLRHGLEPLRAAGFKAIQFLAAGFLGRYNEWDIPLGEAPEPIMDRAQVRDWLAAGQDVGSHSLTHPYLTRLSRERAFEELSASRRKLEDWFSRPIEHFCYPYGDWNEAVRDLVIAAGYKTACTTTPGVNTVVDSPFALKRITVRYRSRNLKAIWLKVRALVR